MQTTLAFVGVATAIVISPGPNLLVVTRNTLAGGRSAGLATAAGIAAGTAAWAVAAGIGLIALFAASPEAAGLIRLAGAAYLFWLGVRSLLARRPDREGEVLTSSPTSGAGWARPFRTGLLSNALHPGQLLFFGSLLPQFAAASNDPRIEMLRLSLIFVAVVITWFSIYALVVSRVRLTGPRGVAARRLSGLALAGFALAMLVGS